MLKLSLKIIYCMMVTWVLIFQTSLGSNMVNKTSPLTSDPQRNYSGDLAEFNSIQKNIGGESRNEDFKIFAFLKSQSVEYLNNLRSLKSVIIQTTLSRIAYILYLKEEWTNQTSNWLGQLENFLKFKNGNKCQESYCHLAVLDCHFNFTECLGHESPFVVQYKNGELLRNVSIEVKEVESRSNTSIIIDGGNLSMINRDGNETIVINEISTASVRKRLRELFQQQKRLLEQLEEIMVEQEKRLDQLEMQD